VEGRQVLVLWANRDVTVESEMVFSDTKLVADVESSDLNGKCLRLMKIVGLPMEFVTLSMVRQWRQRLTRFSRIIEPAAQDVLAGRWSLLEADAGACANCLAEFRAMLLETMAIKMCPVYYSETRCRRVEIRMTPTEYAALLAGGIGDGVVHIPALPSHTLCAASTHAFRSTESVGYLLGGCPPHIAQYKEEKTQKIWSCGLQIEDTQGVR